MRTFLTKRVLVIAVLVVVGLVAASVGYAYWTGNGSGSANGVVGTSGTITLGGTFASGLVPGGSEPVTLTASNSGTSAVQVSTVHLVSVAVDAGHSSCVTTDFSMPDVVENDPVPANAVNDQLAHAGVLSYANTAVSQDTCKNATVTLTLSST